MGRKKRSSDVEIEFEPDEPAELIQIYGRIDKDLSAVICEKVSQIASSGGEVVLLINSPGGDWFDTMAIIASIEEAKQVTSVTTKVLGLAASGAALIAASGTRGKRYAFLHSWYLLHKPFMEFGEGEVMTSKSLQTELNVLRDLGGQMSEILSKYTGKPKQWIETKLDQDGDIWVPAREAKEWGLVDVIF